MYQLLYLRVLLGLGTVVHASNSRYSGGRDHKDWVPGQPGEKQETLTPPTPKPWLKQKGRRHGSIGGVCLASMRLWVQPPASLKLKKQYYYQNHFLKYNQLDNTVNKKI
jgi:hypothetical protein